MTGGNMLVGRDDDGGGDDDDADDDDDGEDDELFTLQCVTTDPWQQTNK